MSFNVTNSQLQNSPIDPFDFTNVKIYKGIVGWVYSLFGSTVALKKDQSTIYLDLKSYGLGLCKNSHSKFSSFESEDKLRDILLRTLNPVAGETANYDYAKDLFNYSREKQIHTQIQNCATKEEIFSTLNEHLKSFNLAQRKILKVPYNTSLLQQILKPGDILFKTYTPEDSTVLAKHIIFGQQLKYRVSTGKKERDACNISHVSIYIGDGKIAEAAWPPNNGEEVRIIELENRLVAIKNSFEYLVTRPQDSHLASRTAEVAKKIIIGTEEKSTARKLSYSFSLAIRSLFSSSFFGINAKKEYVNNYFDYTSDNQVNKKSSPTQFFCSYFATYCFQIAEAQQIIGSKIELEKLEQKTTAPEANHWEKLKTIYSNWKNLQELEKYAKFKLHAKRTTPMVLRNYVVQNRDQFKDVYLLSNR